ncbi:hypothetical protein VaNZ11_013604 [Volvox africanus]|uniref:Protein kinase domain-containing protein n=1 Tax=Volvox africanus TaxID=51714 RepID=A0ABQ5SGK7_9CHLO|nr:hypothetical protein VaNZ11_013604 [Volvox africanus]
MSARRLSVDGGPIYPQNGPASPGKPKMHLALLKLSTANAFAKALSAASATKGAGPSSSSLSPEAPSGFHGVGGTQNFPEDNVAFSSWAAAIPAADSVPPLSPQPRSPYYGMYAEYEDIMELLHSGVVADGSARRLLSHVAPEQLVHVAHLGIGACCSVDLVAVHCSNGSRLLAAAKSCYLPPSDPRLRASQREADLLRRCADCPFIIQLLAVLQQEGLHDAGPAATPPPPSSPPGSCSPADTPARTSLQLSSSGGGLSELEPGVSVMWNSCVRSGEARGLDGAHSLLSMHSGAVMAATMSSPAYQAWAQWRGGGAVEDLEWQTMQRLAAGATAATSMADSSGGGALFEGLGGGTFCGANPRAYSGMGNVQMGSLAGVSQANSGGWCQAARSSSSPMGMVDDTLAGCGDGGVNYGNHGCGFAPHYGGGGPWISGGGSTGGNPPGRRCRRASMEIIDMYVGCTGMGGGSDAAAGPAGAVEPAVLYTLLIGWARCGDLRRLVQLLLGRSVAHQNNKVTGAAPAVSGLPLLMPEDAVRFYAGCLVLALEHLHSRLHTVHRDLKLANLLLLESGYVVVGDLGTAVDLNTVPGGRLNSRVGSPGHMAPECRDRQEAGYDTAADMWSVGACLFSLLTGQLPAGLGGPPNRQWTPQVSRYWSHELQDLMGRLLAWSPSQRPTVVQLQHDPWFRGFNWKALHGHKMQPPSNTPWRELLWWPKENRHLM